MAAVSGLQGLTKELLLACVRVRPEAACRTCHFAGIIESSNFVRKSMPIMGVGYFCKEKIKFKIMSGERNNLAAAAPNGNKDSVRAHQVRTCGRRRAGMQQD